MSLSNLAPGRARAVNVSPAPAPAAPAREQAKPPPVEQLTVNDVRDLSLETINALVPINPTLVANLITQAGARARGELPSAPMSSLRPAARAIVLAGERARGRELNAEEAEFLTAYVEEHWPS